MWEKKLPSDEYHFVALLAAQRIASDELITMFAY
jgi:hypothetical protein